MNHIFNLTANPKNLNLHPENKIEEVMQNINTLLTTPKGSVPLYRDFGLDLTLGDEPLLVAKARVSSEVFRLIQKYEPRAQVVEIDFDMAESVLVPKVKVRLND